MKLERITQHAVNRAVERFGVQRKLAENWIRTNFNKASFVANVINDKGEMGRFFSHKNVGFVLDETADIVVTVYEPIVPAQIYEKLAKVARRELTEAERAERVTERRNTIAKAELQIELAELNLRLLRARSQATINAVTGRIRAIEQYCAELDVEITAVKRKKSIVAKGVAAYL